MFAGTMSVRVNAPTPLRMVCVPVSASRPPDMLEMVVLIAATCVPICTLPMLPAVILATLVPTLATVRPLGVEPIETGAMMVTSEPDWPARKPFTAQVSIRDSIALRRSVRLVAELLPEVTMRPSGAFTVTLLKVMSLETGHSKLTLFTVIAVIVCALLGALVLLTVILPMEEAVPIWLLVTKDLQHHCAYVSIDSGATFVYNSPRILTGYLKNMEFVSVEGATEYDDQEDMEQAMLDEEDDEEPLFEEDLDETAEAAIGLA